MRRTSISFCPAGAWTWIEPETYGSSDVAVPGTNAVSGVWSLSSSDYDLDNDNDNDNDNDHVGGQSTA